MTRKILPWICAISLVTGYLNAQTLSLSPNNIDEILEAMTLEEKAALLVGGGNRVFNGEGTTIGKTEDLVPGAAGITTPIPRLGIPPTVLTDGPAGVRISPTRKGTSETFYATGFPVGTALASTWNTQLVEEVGKAIGNEVLEYGCDVLLAPGMNIFRSPLNGRNFEYYSEDPVVTGKIAAAYVNGIQSNGVGTSLKHYAANSQETNRLAVDEVVSPRALREIYLKGFEIAVKEANPWTIMSSYNRLNGPYTQENGELLTSVLRDDWGFNGIVMTDWTGRRNTLNQVLAGNDLMEPGMKIQVEDIIELVNTGKLPIEEVDRNVKRMLEYIVKTPHFRNYKFSNKPDLEKHAQITRKAATEGMVLLKNDGNALPLTGIDTVALFGISSYDFLAGGTGSGDVNKPYVVDLLEGFNNAGITVLPDLKDLYLSYKNYEENKRKMEEGNDSWILGRIPLNEMPLSRDIIDRQAKIADIGVITLVRQAGEGADRSIDNDFNLSEVERQLITDVSDAFHMQHKPVVVILNMGSVIETASWKNYPDAILVAWQPGQEGGNSVVDVLTGVENPSGKLTMTWPVNVMDHPSSLNFPLKGENEKSHNRWERNKETRNYDYTLHEEGINVGYRYFDTAGKPVSYPFGYGLSYTDFKYSKPTIMPIGDGFTATITVTNTGDKAGKEVVQLYVSAPSSDIEKPSNELKAFAKTKLLKPGESQVIRMNVSDYSLASYHENTHSWVADKGIYKVKFGANINDIKETLDYKLNKTLSWETSDVLHPSVHP